MKNIRFLGSDRHIGCLLVCLLFYVASSPRVHGLEPQTPIGGGDLRQIPQPPVDPSLLRPRPSVPPQPPQPPLPPEPQPLQQSGSGSVSVHGQFHPVHPMHPGGGDFDIHSELSGAFGDLQRNFNSMRLGFTGSGAPRLLVLPGPDMDSDGVVKLQENLAIMHRLLSKSLEAEGAHHGGFRFEVGSVRLGDRGELDALYLKGYGALFLLQVDYPVATTQAEAEPEVGAVTENDDAWEQARRELRGGGGARAEDRRMNAGEGFDKQRVDRLKMSLKEAVLHGTNLQQLADDELITVLVLGSWMSAAPKQAQGGMRRGGVGAIHRWVPGSMPLEDRRQTSLQLQVAKKDVVAFKAGKLPADKFDARMSWQQRVDPVR